MICEPSTIALWIMAVTCTIAGLLVGASLAIDAYPYEGLPRTWRDHLRSAVAFIAGFSLTACVVAVVLFVLWAVWNLVTKGPFS